MNKNFYKYLNEYSKYNTLLISSILFIFVGVFVLNFGSDNIKNNLFAEGISLDDEFQVSSK